MYFDLLGRAGRVEEAYRLIRRMPFMSGQDRPTALSALSSAILFTLPQTINLRESRRHLMAVSISFPNCH
ncbi:hypothetical protein Tsubulata_029234 [Turnera subulata]|uniref:Pentacotripeptide-repeat region of PRORP domain-containing protein n=1 Tax=Turnera subulata TaxID=218843 RepID=A0A9Q0JCK3_9ROSI|nr:hypothetical protein Tsubulata_029234 [Turnera subulata]